MKALAAFRYIYNADVRIFFEDGWLDIADETTWLTLEQHYTKPKTMQALIEYHHFAINWLEIEL